MARFHLAEAQGRFGLESRRETIEFLAKLIHDGAMDARVAADEAGRKLTAEAIGQAVGILVSTHWRMNG